MKNISKFLRHHFRGFFFPLTSHSSFFSLSPMELRITSYIFLSVHSFVINSSVLVRASQVALVVKYMPANSEDVRDVGSIFRLGRCPGGGHGNPLQYSAWRIPMYKGAWQATVHRVSKSQTRLKWLSRSVLDLIVKTGLWLIESENNLYDKQVLAIVLNKITGSDFQDTHAIP